MCLGEGWASRAFFSDDGSTAVEVGLKMAFGKYKMDLAKHLKDDDAFYVRLFLLRFREFLGSGIFEFVSWRYPWRNGILSRKRV